MKLGGLIRSHYSSPEEWGALLKASRFAAIICPIDHTTSPDVAHTYFKEAARLGVTIAEIGVWKNPLSPDMEERKEALDYAKAQLAFADEMGVPCCVNIVGSRGKIWDGAYRDNYLPETYDAIIESVRDIIDTVNPKCCRYTIEPMPWMVPDGPDEYLQLIKDIDRPMFGAHLDFVNMINSPKRYLFANEFIDECFKKLGPHIISCHIKDITLDPTLTVLLHEVAPGAGALDFRHILHSADRLLRKDMPFLLEHMHTDSEYAAAYAHIAAIADQEHIAIR